MAKTKSRKKTGDEKDISASYNRFKEFDGKAYTGVTVGRGHKWNYDKGVWRDAKITPDLWAISYAVTKRRAGHAPKGSGATVGTDYHWYILAHQHVEKLNADDYSTVMTGFKFKIAHRRADKENWNASAQSQRKHMIAFLEGMIAHLKEKPLELSVTLGKKSYEGEALPIAETRTDHGFQAYDIVLNNESAGIARRLKSGWKLDAVPDQKLGKAIGKALEEAIETQT
jgi:hypothetical protein